MTVYYDITDVLEYAQAHSTPSGIQRASLEILSQLVNRHGPEQVRVLVYHPSLRCVASHDAAYFAGQFAFDQASFNRAFRCLVRPLDQYVTDRHGRNKKTAWHKARIGLTNIATGGQYYRKRGIGPARPGDATVGPCDNSFAFSPGDVVFVCGASWGYQPYLEFLATSRRTHGVKVVHFVHDLIPLLMPEHVVDGLTARFAAWLAHVSRNSDALLTNSKATKSDLDGWLTDHDVRLPTRIVRLAHQFGHFERAPPPAARWTVDEHVGSRVRNAARLPFVLCVGSLESRKNIWTLANVWRRIRDKLGMDTPRLVFAGNPGWLRDDFDAFLAGTGSLDGWITVLERPTDAELAHLYRSCLFSVFVSYKEGWGLPVGEGLWFGRPVVTSRVSSMPEAGGVLADYVDPTSPDSIEAAVLRLVTDGAYREARAAEIAGSALRTWTDVADDLWDELADLP